MLFKTILQFFARLFISKEEGRVNDLITKLQQDSCDDQVQKELFDALDKSSDSIEKIIPVDVGLDYEHVDHVLSLELTPFSKNERQLRREQRKAIRQEKRKARRDRRLERKEARKRRRGDQVEAKDEQKEKKKTGKRFIWQNDI